MGSNGTHKNKTHLKKGKKIKSEYSHWKVHLKKSAAPLKVKNEIRKKSWFMVVKISTLVTRNQRKNYNLI